MCVLKAPSGDTMQNQYAPCEYVHTRVRRHYARIVDLRWCRSIHSCESCTFLQQLAEKFPSCKPPAHPTQLCHAVHYGFCSAIKLTQKNGPAASIEPASTGTPPVVKLSAESSTKPSVQNVAQPNVQNVTQPNVQNVAQPTVQPHVHPPPGQPGVPRVAQQTVQPSAPQPAVVQPSVQDERKGKELTQANKENDVAAKNKEGSLRRGEPDGEANAFLRQKTAQLQEKRQREQQQKDALGKVGNSVDTTPKGNMVPVSTSGGGEANLDVKGLKKKDGLIAAAISSLRQQQQETSHQQPSVKVRVSPPETGAGEPEQPCILPEQQPSKQSSQAGEQSGKTVQTVTKKPQKKADSVKKTPTVGADVNIPQFYFPLGPPATAEDIEATALKIKEAFAKVEGGKVHKSDMGPIAKACGFPFYWKCPLFRYAGGEKNGHITLQSFLAAWKKLVTGCHDDSAKFMRIMTPPGVSYLCDEDFLPLIQDVVDTHPGLSFLQDAPEFHSRYVQTVISRIFYCVNRSWSGRVTLTELRRSNFLQTVQLLEEDDDINQITDFFSYEHFYVIYCKFWELDKDHDLFISREDLACHNDHAISMKMIDRIFSGTVIRNLIDDKMSYKDFVWFLISEEDKRHHTSIEYWFRCMDLDGDGVISMYEMEYFYDEQVQKMEALGIETLPFEDCLCQMLDMIKPAKEGCISLADLKNCKLTPIFFDTFFNLEKYLEHEQKDPFANLRDGDGDEPELSDWERYASEEYEILVAEEGGNEEINYEDDFEPDDEQMSPREGTTEILQLSEPPHRKGLPNMSEEIYNNQENIGY